MIYIDTLELIIQSYEMGKDSIIDFRRLFLPSPDECDAAWFHYEWDKILRNGDKHFICEAFRESGKSQIVIRAHTLYRLVYPKRECSFIVFIMANQKTASKRLKEIADDYLSNDFLKRNLIKVREQSEKAFEVQVKDIHGEPIIVRIEAYGKGSAIRGLSNKDLRPQLVIIDDPQDLEDSLSETITDNDWEWFLSDIVFLGQYTRIFMIGNNLGERCLAERIINGAEELNFEVMKIPILDMNENSNWAAKWPIVKILEEKEKWQKLGKIDTWFREKMCLAISPDSQIFKKEHFRYYDPRELNREDLSVYTTVDLAISEKATADYTVVMTVGVNSQNQWFVLDCVYGRWNPSIVIDQVFKTVQKWRPISLGVEKVAYQAAFQHFLIKEMPKRNIYVLIEELLAQKKKELRIQAMQPRFVAGSVWFPMGAAFLSELETELLTFPKGIHDDLIDAMAYMEQIAHAPVGGWSNEEQLELPFAGAI